MPFPYYDCIFLTIFLLIDVCLTSSFDLIIHFTCRTMSMMIDLQFDQHVEEVDELQEQVVGATMNLIIIIIIIIMTMMPIQVTIAGNEKNDPRGEHLSARVCPFIRLQSQNNEDGPTHFAICCLSHSWLI
jgi:hypothetical protein